MSPAQCRAGRALVNMTQADLADRAKVGLSSVRDLETERREVSPAIVSAIMVALERAGVEFIAPGKPAGRDGGAGVRLSK